MHEGNSTAAIYTRAGGQMLERVAGQAEGFHKS